MTLGVLEDSYFDSNLGRSISVRVFFDLELHIPIFGISVNSTALRQVNAASEDLETETLAQNSDPAPPVELEVFDEDATQTLLGGDGDDTFYNIRDNASDTFVGGAGRDIIVWYGNDAVTVNVATGQASISGKATDSFVGIEAFQLGDGNDVVVDGGGRMYDGAGGSDTVAFAFNSSEYRIAASGTGYLIERAYLGRDVDMDDRYLFVDNVESFTFAGVAASIGGLLVTIVNGTNAGEILNGSAGSNTISGLDGNDTIYAGAGSDFVDGGVGADTLVGGDGNDAFVVDNAGDSVVENASGGNDTIFASVSYSIAALSNIENISLVDYGAIDATGNAANNVLQGNVASNTLDGDGGADVLIGSLGDDYLIGGAGEDTYKYLAGDGADTIEDWGYSASIDVVELRGISAEHTTIGRGDSDFWDLKLSFLDGGSITVKAGFIGAGTVVEEVQFEDSGTTWTASDIREMYLDAQATSGNDYIHGFIDTADTIVGRGGNDELYGYTGDDTLNGNNGNDVLFGNEGADRLIGEAGEDYMIGGEGADTFAFGSTSEGTDWIDDFVAGQDKIDLSAIAGIDDFAGVLAIAEEWGGTTWLNFNQSNSIRLQNVALASLSAGDFVLA